MIIELPCSEKESIEKACAVAGANVEFFIVMQATYSDGKYTDKRPASHTMTVMITSDGEDITPKMAWRISALVASYEEARLWGKPNG